MTETGGMGAGWKGGEIFIHVADSRHCSAETSTLESNFVCGLSCFRCV